MSVYTTNGLSDLTKIYDCDFSNSTDIFKNNITTPLITTSPAYTDTGGFRNVASDSYSPTGYSYTVTGEITGFDPITFPNPTDGYGTAVIDKPSYTTNIIRPSTTKLNNSDYSFLIEVDQTPYYDASGYYSDHCFNTVMLFKIDLYGGLIKFMFGQNQIGGKFKAGALSYPTSYISYSDIFTINTINPTYFNSGAIFSYNIIRYYFASNKSTDYDYIYVFYNNTLCYKVDINKKDIKLIPGYSATADQTANLEIMNGGVSGTGMENAYYQNLYNNEKTLYPHGRSKVGGIRYFTDSLTYVAPPVTPGGGSSSGGGSGTGTGGGSSTGGGGSTPTGPGIINRLELGPYFKGGWNPEKYIIFANNKLLNRSDYRLMIPAPDNTLKYKVVYFFKKFPAGTPIDVYYVECDDNFSNVPFNKDLTLYAKEIYAAKDNQKVVKIPYPYMTYPRDDHTLMVFTDKGVKLDRVVDFKTSLDRTYITLSDKFALKKKHENFLVFIFPYTKADFEIEDEEDAISGKKTTERSGVTFFYSFSKITGDTTSGLVEFDPPFTKYDLDKSDFILFGNSTWIDPDRYDFIDNSHIQFIDPTDKLHAGYCNYIMVIFSENKTNLADRKKYKFTPYPVEATTQGQLEFKFPIAINDKVMSHLVFRNSVLMDEQYRYTYINDGTEITIKFNNPNDGVKKGCSVTFVTYEPRKAINTADVIRFNVLEFPVDVQNNFKIDPLNIKHIKFTKENVMLFVNGTYMNPDRYNIINNTVHMAKGYDLILKDKSITAVYVDATVVPEEDETNLGTQYVNVVEDNDFIWFEEMEAKVKG